MNEKEVTDVMDWVAACKDRVGCGHEIADLSKILAGYSEGELGEEELCWLSGAYAGLNRLIGVRIAEIDQMIDSISDEPANE